MGMEKPELLAPAGNLEKLKIAFSFGADACYVGGTVFGLRKFADNFSLIELKQAVDFANERHKKVYVVLNGFAHEEDLPDLIAHLKDLEKIAPHGFIISDRGVFELAKKYTTVPLHVSTQASVTNWRACQLWKEAGASRIILAREVSIAECQQILSQLDTELEVFIHGAMCASYSGKCVISNYSSGRDSNRGGCVQSCRHTYELYDPDTKALTDTANIMNAKDLIAIDQIPALIDAGLHSLKIEGRMKSNFYVANAVSTYRRAIDEYCETGTLNKDALVQDLHRPSNRRFSSGGLDHRPDKESIHFQFAGYERNADYVGTVKHVSDTELFVEMKLPPQLGESLQLLKQSGPVQSFNFEGCHNMAGQPLEAIRPSSVIRIPKPPSDHAIQPLDILFR